MKRDVDLPDAGQYHEEYKSSHTPAFTVVKPNGYGFWHALTNTGNEWVVLILEKELTPQRPASIEAALEDLSQNQKDRLLTFSAEIARSGDHVFERSANPLDTFGDVPRDTLARFFVALLNTPEGANHEQCTAVALLLKLAKTDKKTVIRTCKQSLKSSEAPSFYLKDILRKLEHRDKRGHE